LVIGPAPGAVRAEQPGVAVVGQQHGDQLLDPGARAGVLDRHDDLDPAVEVALHQVRRAQARLGRAAVGEAEDPRVLEELADDRAHPDPLGETSHPRAERAPGPDDQVDLDALLTRPVERLDRGRVDPMARNRARSSGGRRASRARARTRAWKSSSESWWVR
jgi:hypothetical protein